MTAPEISHLYQPAVLWTPGGVDGYGQPTMGTPVEIRVRFTYVRQERVDQNGNTVMLDGTAIVSQRIAIGAEIWDGELADWYGTGSGGTNNEVMEVKTYKEVSDIQNRYKYREVGLMKKSSNPNPGS